MIPALGVTMRRRPTPATHDMGPSDLHWDIETAIEELGPQKLAQYSYCEPNSNPQAGFAMYDPTDCYLLFTVALSSYPPAFVLFWEAGSIN